MVLSVLPPAKRHRVTIEESHMAPSRIRDGSPANGTTYEDIKCKRRQESTGIHLLRDETYRCK